MGSFSILHWILVLFVLVVPAVIVGLIIWFANRASKTLRRNDHPE